MSDIFVSYKSEDRKRVEPIVDALIAEGFSVWWDVQIEAGTDWRERIKQALQSSACVLVVWTETSVGPQGQFVQDEARLSCRLSCKMFQRSGMVIHKSSQHWSRKN